MHSNLLKRKHNDIGITRAGAAYRNDLTEGVDGELITQIKDLTREYKQ